MNQQLLCIKMTFMHNPVLSKKIITYICWSVTKEFNRLTDWTLSVAEPVPRRSSMRQIWKIKTILIRLFGVWFEFTLGDLSGVCSVHLRPIHSLCGKLMKYYSNKSYLHILVIKTKCWKSSVILSLFLLLYRSACSISFLPPLYWCWGLRDWPAIRKQAIRVILDIGVLINSYKQQKAGSPKLRLLKFIDLTSIFSDQANHYWLSSDLWQGVLWLLALCINARLYFHINSSSIKN